MKDATAETSQPFYLQVGDEVEVFESAWACRRAVMLKGPTGCGKTRFVEAMAARLGRPLITVSCHEDLTAADLLGRFQLTGGDTVWQDGPLTRAVRTGAICYLDEVIEARMDTTVVIHALTDHRRELNLDRRNEVLSAPLEFMLVVSYNPGYQSVLKDLKPSTRQRMVAIELTFPAPEIERKVILMETGLDEKRTEDLVRLAQAIRQLDMPQLPEVCSTRTLIAAAALIKSGLDPIKAVNAAIVRPLSDDPAVSRSLIEMAATYIS
ncbi:MAG: CbbQ/NirQ/NorQ/GpvN family protein [Sinimarinibacterium sp.]|jgi:nitric oxide reductase NorQ protein